MILMGPLKLEIFYDPKVLRCKGRSAETLSPHKRHVPLKELVRFALEYSHVDFSILFLAILLYSHSSSSGSFLPAALG